MGVERADVVTPFRKQAETGGVNICPMRREKYGGAMSPDCLGRATQAFELCSLNVNLHDGRRIDPALTEQGIE